MLARVTLIVVLAAILGASMIALLGALVILRATPRGRAFLALRTREKLRFGRALLGSGLPWPMRLLVGALVLYLASPIDLVPDFIPVLGQVDDIALALVVVVLVVRFVPAAAFDAALAASRAQPAPPTAPRPASRD